MKIYLDVDNVCADFLKSSKEISGIEGYNKEIWQHIDKVDNFFLHLEVMPGTAEGLAFISNEGIPCEFLTAMPLPTGNLWQAQRDKVQWVQDELLCPWQVNVVQNWSHKKYFCRKPTDVLVDDNRRNCDDWISVGGIAVLHTDWESSIDKLKTLMG